MLAQQPVVEVELAVDTPVEVEPVVGRRAALLRILLLLLQIGNLRVLLGIHLLLLRRFRGHVMACCIGNPAHRGGSHYRTAHDSPS